MNSAWYVGPKVTPHTILTSQSAVWRCDACDVAVRGDSLDRGVVISGVDTGYDRCGWVESVVMVNGCGPAQLVIVV